MLNTAANLVIYEADTPNKTNLTYRTTVTKKGGIPTITVQECK